jgi:hypothetical protein
MSKLLFSLRGVPNDEAMEIRVLLTENNIDYYETSPGNWGISMPALWITNNEELDQAQNLLDEYHLHRAITQREIYHQLKKAGKHKRLIDALIEKPIQSIVYFSVSALIIYIYFKMLYQFGF